MSGVSEAELEQLRKDNEKLREQRDNAVAKQAENQAAREREYEASQLEAENIRLQAQVNAAKEASLVGSSKEGVATLMENSKDQIAAAKARLEAPSGPVDTNVDSKQPDDKTGTTQNGGN